MVGVRTRLEPTDGSVSKSEPPFGLKGIQKETNNLEGCPILRLPDEKLNKIIGILLLVRLGMGVGVAMANNGCVLL